MCIGRVAVLDNSGIDRRHRGSGGMEGVEMKALKIAAIGLYCFVAVWVGILLLVALAGATIEMWEMIG